MYQGKVINNLVHEIRSPLFNIKSFLETLYEYYFQLTDIQILEFLEIANQETNRLVRLTSDSLEVARLNTKGITLHKLVYVNGLFKQVFKVYEITCLQKNISVYPKVPIHLPPLVGSYDVGLQILNNLITNSLKFTYPSGVLVLKIRILNRVSIRNRQNSFSFRLEIIDNGIGIKKEDIPSLFTRFKRGSKSKDGLEGVGLGLSIVKELMENQGVNTTLVSNIFRGTCVILHF